MTSHLNLLHNLPHNLEDEVIDTLVESRSLRVERIVSRGHHSEEGFWYDQDQHEWVTVLKGEGIIGYPDGSSITLQEGEHLTIPAHCKHRVVSTRPDTETIWLAVFFSGEQP